MPYTDRAPITREQRVAFIQKYEGAFDEDVILDEGMFQGMKVRDAERILMVNHGMNGTSLEWLLDHINETQQHGGAECFAQYFNDEKYTSLAIRAHLTGWGNDIARRSLGVVLPSDEIYQTWRDYAHSHQYHWGY